MAKPELEFFPTDSIPWVSVVVRAALAAANSELFPFDEDHVQ